MALTLTSFPTSEQFEQIVETACEHGEIRATNGKYNLEQVILEYQILREILFEELEQKVSVEPDAREVLRSFINIGVRKAAVRYVEIAERESELARKELYSFMMQSPTPMVIILYPERKFFLANPAYEHLVGRKVTGKTVLEAFSTEEIGHFLSPLDNVYHTGKSYVGKALPLEIPDGEGVVKPQFLDVGYHAFRDDTGKIKGVLADVQDVTEHVLARKALEKNRAELAAERYKLETIFHRSPAAMVLWKGQDLIFEKVNPEYQKIFGERKLVGKPFLEACPEFRDQPFYELLSKVLETGEPYIGHESLARLAKTEGGPTEDRYFDFTFIRVSDPSGNPYGVYDHAIDVTDRVLARRQLKAASEDLQNAKEDAERANALKSAFLANMSHEIRTPLGAILGFSELLKDPALNFEERNQYVETIVRNGGALTRIIDDILDLAKVEAGRLDIEKIEFSFYDLMSDVVDLFKDKTKQKSIYLLLNIDEDVPSQICSDPTRLRQIFVNLIGNAVKFTDKGGVRISVRSKPVDSKRHEFEIDVKDSGIGLSEDQKAKLFQPFIQADNSMTRKFGGTGLGLVLSQRLANALGGEISLSQCATDQGCTFTLKFTTEIFKSSLQKEVSIDTPVQSKDRSLEGVHVLLAEDAPDNQILIKLLLTRRGATVDIANDGREAVSKALSASHDVVLMDIQMPNMDGYQAKAALDEKAYITPVIALTAHAMTEERLKTKSAGFKDHLTKPLVAEDLVQTIKQYVEKNPAHL